MKQNYLLFHQNAEKEMHAFDQQQSLAQGIKALN